MATVQHPPAFTDLHSGPIAAAPPMHRQDSINTVDMHIPGAWNGTNPGTPVPITEDMKYFGETLKTVPGTVQSYMPAKETVAASGSTILNKAAAVVPASVMNTATNVLPKSMQPTMSPTAADAVPPAHPTDTTKEHPIATTTNTVPHATADSTADNKTLLGNVASVLPAGVIGAATAYLPASMTGKTADTETPAPSTAVQPKAVDTTTEQPAPKEVPVKGESTGSTWSEKAATILPAGAAAYLPTALSPNQTENDTISTPIPKQSVDTTTPAVSSPAGPIVGSTVSPDADVQEALSKAADPEAYKSEIVPPMHSYPSTAPSLPPKDDQKSLESTQAVGGTTPMTLASTEAEADGYPEHNKKGVSGLAAMAATGAVGAATVDHGLKDQRDAAAKQHDVTSRPIEATPADSFMHVVIPATPGAGLHEQEKFAGTKPAGDGTLATHTTPKKKHDRSGSISAGEASPSSPSKSGRFSSIRKLTKKRDKSASRGHERRASAGDAVAPVPVPAHGDSLDANVSDSSPTTHSGEEKRERHVLHKDPPAGHGAHHKEEESPTTYNDDVPSASNQESSSTPSMLANPFSPNSPSASSPSKVGFRDKVKGEFMVVQGSLTRDKGLKEAGEKLKKGTM